MLLSPCSSTCREGHCPATWQSGGKCSPSETRTGSCCRGLCCFFSQQCGHFGRNNLGQIVSCLCPRFPVKRWGTGAPLSLWSVLKCVYKKNYTGTLLSDNDERCVGTVLLLPVWKEMGQLHTWQLCWSPGYCNKLFILMLSAGKKILFLTIIVFNLCVHMLFQA